MEVNQRSDILWWPKIMQYAQAERLTSLKIRAKGDLLQRMSAIPVNPISTEHWEDSCP